MPDTLSEPTATDASRSSSSARTLRLALPKGRQADGVQRLFADAGVSISVGARAYRPRVELDGVEAKLLKPRNVVEMLAAGARDVGFAGADWVAETGAPLVELLDTGLDPVRLVAAAPAALLEDGRLPRRPLVVATEYVALAEAWIERAGLDARVLRTHGATEVFPPEDADVIVDNSASGATLRANGLELVDELMQSTTRLYAAPGVLDDAVQAERVDGLVLLLRAVLDARTRVMLELNVDGERLDAVLDALPCMRQPTIAALRDGAGFAVRSAVPRDELARLVPRLKTLGGTDVVVSPVRLLIP